MSPALAKAPTPPTQAKAASTAAPAPAATGPNRQRRRPRKLNKDTETEVKAATPSSAAAAAAAPAANAKETVLPASTQEIEALKSRVRGLEAKVEELYKEGVDRRDKSPRRRGKARKDSSQQQVPTLSTPEPSSKVVEVEDEADEELGRLEDELEVARRDLESFQPRSARPRGKRTTSGDTEYIEEIPRGNVGEVEDTVDTGDRQVTLTGSYRIPLPSTHSLAHVVGLCELLLSWRLVKPVPSASTFPKRTSLTLYRTL
jgi:flagellar motility protein MotE (MotC chaperone)